MKYQKQSLEKKQEDLMDRLDILQKIVNKKMKIKEGAEILEMSPDHVGRLCAKFREGGVKALIHREKKGRPPLSAKAKEAIMEVVRDKYADFGPTLASEKLWKIHGIKISRETLRKLMVKEGLWLAKKAKKVRIHQSRLQRPRFGELVQIDGSHHDWFEGRAEKCCLYVFIDDATRKIIYLRFEKAETTFGYMRCVKGHIESFGRPVSYFSDRHSIFLTTRNKEGVYEETQFKKALNALGIKLINARSPQSKGRVERCNQTLQDRLVKELRLRGISSIEEANKFLAEYMGEHNAAFSVPPACNEDAHRPLLQSKEALELILSTRENRKVTKNLEIRWKNQVLQIQNAGKGRRLQQAGVEVCELLNGEIKIIHEGKSLDYKVFTPQKAPHFADEKELNGIVDGFILEVA